ELAVRDDIFTEDTLAWTAARSGHWDVARLAIAKALRYGTQDPTIRKHAAAIEAHFRAERTNGSAIYPPDHSGRRLSRNAVRPSRKSRLP
ncbi:MAG: hypothetical protein JWO66_2288, partial [Candidatus Eremiobacteraeota bacterium]|nr:hypothetical protein [Candidatus Eremiobacteraeota bacterium]